MDEARLNVLLPLVATVEAVANEDVDVDFVKMPLGVSGLLLFWPSSRQRPVEEQGVLSDGAVAVMDIIFAYAMFEEDGISILVCVMPLGAAVRCVRPA